LGLLPNILNIYCRYIYDFSPFARQKQKISSKKEKGPGEPSKLFLEDLPGPFYWAFIKLGNNLIFVTYTNRIAPPL
jgi:hypothetical protein